MPEQHKTRVPEVEALTDQVMNWYSMTEAYWYTMRPYAALVAVELYRQGLRAPQVTQEQIKEADRVTGGKMQELWAACNEPESCSYRCSEPSSMMDGFSDGFRRFPDLLNGEQTAEDLIAALQRHVTVFGNSKVYAYDDGVPKEFSYIEVTRDEEGFCALRMKEWV